jgi:hypothetical protein
MRSLLALGGLVGIAMLLPASQAFAQSGVISGPPQVQAGPGGPGSQQPGPSAGPNAGPNVGPNAGPNAGGRGDVWIAVVGGFDGSGRRAAVGYSGFQRSRPEAEDAAIRACQRSDPSVACRNPFAVSRGCLYIVPGSRPGGMTWGRGGTQKIAFEECRRGGYTCPSSKLVGGCVPGLN